MFILQMGRVAIATLFSQKGLTRKFPLLNNIQFPKNMSKDSSKAKQARKLSDRIQQEANKALSHIAWALTLYLFQHTSPTP